ncbi:MAG: trimethylamine methyltransferase family protein [Desulfobacterales bacterium]|jgi:trimethylamine--corrinoid protein Co-methyltransferase
MYDRMHELTREQIRMIHDASMDILQYTGIKFNEPEALAIFKKRGIKVDGDLVYLAEADVLEALETAPSQFVIQARNPENDVTIGEKSFAFAPGYGPPFITTGDGKCRQGVMEDYNNFCKLIQTSKYLDMNGFLMIEPSDVSPDKAYLDMLYANMVLCDKPFLGCPTSRQGSIDSLEMAGILWEGKNNIRNKPCLLANITTLSPLQFAAEMAASLIEFARFGQPCAIVALIMAGFTGPVTMAGVLTLQNAEILAGIALTQLVNPGTPVIYGSTSSPIDMKSGVISIGAPEMSQFVSATAQMARFYGLPSRGGGSLTDAQFPDIQAGMESALLLSAAIQSGVHYILHSCGILGSYLAMSFEKFVVDEELCGMFRKLAKPVEVTDDTISLDIIKEVGIGGLYLTHDQTLARCRTEYFVPHIAVRQTYENWAEDGMLRADQRAAEVVQQRLASYQKPDIDRNTARALLNYVEQHKT